MMTPADYEAWYYTPRGRWIGDLEFTLLQKLLSEKGGLTLLDVGCGTGYFTRRFGQSGLSVTGLDPNRLMLDYARLQSDDITYLQGRVEALPFDDNSFDYVSAATSLCFVEPPERALQEMWRVAKSAVVLGLLNRHGLLYRQKRNSRSYHGARWDSGTDVSRWLQALAHQPRKVAYRSAIFLPGGGCLSRFLERRLSNNLLLGSFLVVYMEK